MTMGLAVICDVTNDETFGNIETKNCFPDKCVGSFIIGFGTPNIGIAIRVLPSGSCEERIAIVL